MRIVFDPIIVNPDGISVNRADDHRAPLFYLDPKKLSAQGIREAVEYANTDRAAATLKGFKDADPELAQDHFISDMISPPARTEYRNGVTAFAAGGSFGTHIEKFLRSRLENARDNPDATLAALRKSMDAPPPEWKLPPSKPPRLDAAKQGYKIKLGKAIDALPPHLKTLLKDEKITLVCAEKIWNFFPVEAAVAMYDSNSIGMAYGFIHDKDIPSLSMALKEEALHYFEQKAGVTDSEPYRRAAQAVLADEARMREIDALGEQAHHGVHKIAVREYVSNNRPAELFVEYFHIRDHLAETLGRNGEKKANARVEKLFGAEIHSICQDFEASLKQKAAALGGGRAA